MLRTLWVSAVVVAVALIGVGAISMLQEPRQEMAATQPANTVDLSKQVRQLPPLEESGRRDLVGAHVRSPEGEFVGKIKTLLRAPSTGAEFALLHYTPVPIHRDRDILVPFELLVPASNGEFSLDIGRYQLEYAPDYKADQAPAVLSAYWAKQNQDVAETSSREGGASDLGIIGRAINGLKHLFSAIFG